MTANGPQHEAAIEAGVTYRQLDHWSRRGLLPGAAALPGSGRPRTFTPDGIRAARALGRLSALGIAPSGPLARAVVRRIGSGVFGSLVMDGVTVDVTELVQP